MLKFKHELLKNSTVSAMEFLKIYYTNFSVYAGLLTVKLKKSWNHLFEGKMPPEDAEDKLLTSGGQVQVWPPPLSG
jgi:hypothetical protein